MIWFNFRSAAPHQLVIAVLCAAVSGCSARQVFEPLMGKGPSVSGRWVGKLASVTVYDSKGGKYEAAAIEVISGPRLPYDMGDVPQYWGGGRLPLLMRGHDLVERKDLPQGVYAVVSGDMMFATPLGRHTPVMRVPVDQRGRQLTGEHVIALQGKPKVSDDVTYTTPWGGEEITLQAHHTGPDSRPQ